MELIRHRRPPCLPATSPYHIHFQRSSIQEGFANFDTVLAPKFPSPSPLQSGLYCAKPIATPVLISPKNASATSVASH
ncbi:MAG: hypothetical protein Q9226_008291, partial [Calogaya cf. arnoldii]